MTKRLTAPSLRVTPWRKKSLAAPQSAEERWDAEGGSSQTRVPRRAQRYER